MMRARSPLWSGLALALALCSGLAAAATTPPDLIPLEHFTREDSLGIARISPDGKTLAANALGNGRSVLLFADLSTRKVLASVSAGTGARIDDFQWVSDTRVLLRTGPTILGMDKDGQKQAWIYGGAYVPAASPRLITAIEADGDHVLITEFDKRRGWFNWDSKPHLVRLDVFNGRREELGRAPLNGATVLADHDDQVRLALGYDHEARLTLSSRSKPDAPWSNFDLPGFRMQTVRLLRFSADNGSVYLVGARTDDAFAALYKLDLATRTTERVAGIDGADVTDVVMDFAGREVVGVRGVTDGIAYHWLDAEGPMARTYAKLARAFPTQQIEIINVTRDGSRALLFVSSGVNPGEYYVLDAGTQNAEFMLASRDWIDARRMQRRLAVELKARDGLTLHAYVTKPPGEESHPLVVLVRNEPYDTRETWRFDWQSQLLASRGYAVLQVNTRGTPGYGPDFEAAGYHEWGRAMQDDLTDATRWAIEQKIAPAGRICIMGVGYGGYAALMGAVREPNLYRCAIGYGGIYDLEAYAEYENLRRPMSWHPRIEQVIGSNPADLEARSPINHVDRINIPVFLLHGEGNGDLDPLPAKQLRSALRKRGQRVEWMDLGLQSNPVRDEDLRRQVCERILAFLDSNLK